jgi:hypothetical protein
VIELDRLGNARLKPGAGMQNMLLMLGRAEARPHSLRESVAGVFSPYAKMPGTESPLQDSLQPRLIPQRYHQWI